MICISKSSSITESAPSECLVSYPGHSLGALTLLQRCSRCILQRQPTGQLDFIKPIKKNLIINYTKNVNIKVQCTFGLVGLVIWYINHCLLFNSKSIFILRNSSISNNSVRRLNVKAVPSQTIQINTSTQFSSIQPIDWGWTWAS